MLANHLARGYILAESWNVFIEIQRKIPDIRLIVIYTGDVLRAENKFEMPCMTLRMEQVFIAELPEEEIYQTIEHKLATGGELTEQELMQLVILPLAGKGVKNKQKRIEQIIKTTRLIKKEADQIFVLTGLLVSTDKFISEENAEIIRRLLDMTKVGRMLYEEGIEEGRNKMLQLVGKVFTVLRDEPALTNKEIADRLYCNEKDVDTIRKMFP